MSDWIMAGDRLPELTIHEEEYDDVENEIVKFDYSELVLVYYKDEWGNIEYEIAYYLDDFGWATKSQGDLINDVIAWMPLPEAI